MSSMRNAVYRRQHRERGQLSGREKWGILEKHKDYSLRARDYNLKKAKLKRLREKARDRNPDEFAFGMLSKSTGREGFHGAREHTHLSHETVKLLKTQDAGYLRVTAEKIRREMERLEEEVRLQDGLKEVFDRERRGSSYDEEDDDDDDEEMDEDEDEFSFGGKKNTPSRKIIFADDRDEQKKLAASGDESSSSEDDDEEMDENDDSFGAQLKEKQQQQQQPNQPLTKKQLEALKQAEREKRLARRIKRRAADARRNRLAALKKQYEEITKAERELELQRARMAHAIGGVNKNGVKWKVRERKR
ncbi:hypothetical protein VTN49DRAFT_2653 [Thermomyces lanuginosus]|uniref:uncharacterized protein n=1 Tax=Thermomyces lanuginosus TaxID=5541 RepID=UPI0037441A66